MKAIAIYSGKGGVGKSTVSALLALALAKNHKVALLDFDINTPSAPILFGGKEVVGDLKIFSLGFSKTTTALTGKLARGTLRELVDKVLTAKPDIVIIDLPPGADDIHLSLCSSLKPSSFLLVVQPNELSLEQAKRATDIFEATGIPIAGVIANMTGKIFGRASPKIFDLPVLASLPLNADIAKLGNTGKIAEIDPNPLDKIAEALLTAATHINWDVLKPDINEGDTFGEVLLNLSEGKSRFEIERQLVSITFAGLKSWDEMREYLQHEQPFYDKFLEENTTDVLRRMLEHLDNNNEGLFNIIKVPNTEITLFPGEIGICHLQAPTKSYYGVPRLQYPTDKGEVTLFANEVAPVTNEYLLALIKAKEIVQVTKSAIPRYIPTPDIMNQVDNIFGHLTYIPKNWRELYKELGIVVTEEVVNAN